jgi:hypothetical protein
MAVIHIGRSIEFLCIKFFPENLPGKFSGGMVLIRIEDNFFMCALQLLIQIIAPDFKKERINCLIGA